MELKEFYKDFMQEIFLNSGAEEDFHESTFTEMMCDELIEQARIEDYTLINFIKSSKNIRVDAWNHNGDTELLTLIVTDFRYSDDPDTLTTADARKAFKQGEQFLSASSNRLFASSMEETTPGYELAQAVSSNTLSVSAVEFLLLTNAVAGERIKQPPASQLGDIKLIYDIWDLSRLHRIRSSKQAREQIEIDFTESFPEGLPCLQAFTGSDACESYLFVIPGNHLADLYENYGERLLEQNVRTFLQFRGNVNKGIRNTIQNEPDMFFAYNNGICATAEKVERDHTRQKIKSILNLQIVNGGQTTASIFTSRRKMKNDLSKVYVQVKLTVINPESVDDVVPRISQYANTQNKVSAADFYSNHPFHLRIEEIARRLWAPSQAGGQTETHWFYERARGQYANAMANLTPARLRAFKQQSPRNQMFTKTDLAKFVQTYAMLPHKVSQGAQKIFGDFAGKMSRQWDKKETEFNELYFKQLIAKAIIFRNLDRQIMRQPWYGGYKANVVTYTIAKLVYEIREKNRRLDLMNIWTRQEITPALSNQLVTLAEYVNNWIKDSPEGIRNISEWCKRESCWTRIQNESILISPELLRETIGLEEVAAREKTAEKTQKIDNGINCQKHVFNKGADYWKRLSSWSLERGLLSDKEMSILAVACSIPSRIPSEKQCSIIVNIEEKAVEEGYWDKE